MARGIFGGRKGSRQLEATTGWPQLPGTVERTGARGLDLPAMAYAISSTAPNTANVPAATPETELLERIAAVRSAVADTLFEVSKDYQILCNLMHENLETCDEAIEELRRRLAGNVHYAVLAKLDEVHTLVEAHVAGK